MRRRYTGEPVQHAAEQLGQHTDLPYIPAAKSGQDLLESAVMEQLGRTGEYWAYPFGIVSTRVKPSGMVIALEAGHSGPPPPWQPWPMSEKMLERLLPIGEGMDALADGVRHLRVRGIDGPDLRLGLLDYPSEIVLRGEPGTRWLDLLAKHRREIIDAGMNPLWDLTSSASEEVQEAAQYPESVEIDHALAWLGSGMLRRIGLWRSTSVAWEFRAWANLRELIFEVECYQYRPAAHHQFVQHLTDELWGLPLQITKQECNCYLPQAQQGTWCTYHLHRRDGRSGSLQLRFKWRHDHHFDHREDAVVAHRREAESMFTKSSTRSRS